MTFHIPPSLFSLNKSRFWKLHSSICWSCNDVFCMRQMNARQRAAVMRWLMDPLVKTFLISITENVCNRVCSPIQNKTNIWINWFGLIPWQIDALRLNAEFKELSIVGISSWSSFFGKPRWSGHIAGYVEGETQSSRPPLTVSGRGGKRGRRTHWLDASLQCEACGRGVDSALWGFNVTALLYLLSVQMATRV